MKNKLLEKKIKVVYIYKLDLVLGERRTNDRVGICASHWRYRVVQSVGRLPTQVALSAEASQRLHQSDGWRCFE